MRDKLSAKAGANQRQQLDDGDYPPSPQFYKQAGDKSVASLVKITMDGNSGGRANEGLFDTVSPNPEAREDSPGKAPSAAHVMQALTRYIMQKDKGGPTVKALYNQRKMNETIFEAVFEEFAKGQRLRPYAQSRLEREARLAGRCAVSGHDHAVKKQRVSKKEQAQK
mgnify:CR=1 FL=1